MIDLDATRSRMLAEIGACAAPERLSEPSDPRLPCSEHARLVVGGRPRRELFRVLEFALSARFGAVPRAERIRDLLVPLRSALGNAHKHGNRLDRARRIEVEVVTAPRGALLAIGDEGPGFDVRAIVARMRRGEEYFTRQGSGLRALESARSRVAWEAGGRRLLVCFLPSPGGGALLARGDVASARIARALGAGLAEGSADAGAAPLEVCGVIVEAADAPAPLRVRCMLRERIRDGASPAVHVLSGRLFASGDLARRDLAAAARLRELLPEPGIEIPRPIGRVRDEPGLALYDFDPWLDLREYLAQRGPAAHAGVARRLAALLGELQRSGAGLQAGGGRIAGQRRFGPDCVHYGVDGRFALDGFAELVGPSARLDLRSMIAEFARPDDAPCDRRNEMHGALD